MAEAAALETSFSNDHYQRIVRLLVKPGIVIIRDLFNHFHSPSELPRILNSHRSILQLLFSEGRLSQVDWKKLYPTNYNYVKSSDFDLILLFKLLTNICGLREPLTGWDSFPYDIDVGSLEADIVRVKYIFHVILAQNYDMEDDELGAIWEHIRNSLLRIVYWHNASTRDWERHIDDSYTSPITEGDRRSFLSLFPAIAIRCVSRTTTGVTWIVEKMWEGYKSRILMNEIQEAIFPTAGIIVVEIRPGSVIVRVRDLDDLMDFWERYQTGELRNDFENVLVTEEIWKLGEKVKLTVIVSEEEYQHTKLFLEELIPYKNLASSEAETDVEEEVIEMTAETQPVDSDESEFLAYGNITDLSFEAETDLEEEVLGTIETILLDGDELSLVYGPFVKDRMSKFKAHFAKVTSKIEVDKMLSYSSRCLRHTEASNIIWAYRVLESDKGDYIHASDDGGEYLAGTRLEHLLHDINAINVVVIVTCWDGDVYLGLDKFRNINACALNLLMEHEMVPRMAPQEVVLFLEKMEDYFKAKKHKAAHAAYAALSQEAQPTPSAEFEIIIHSETISVPKSSFQGHLARVTSQGQVDQVLAQLKQDRKIQKARFNMFAYRIFDEEKKTYLEGESDDGENRGGKRLLHLLQTMDVENAVVIVTRWKEGDVHLGPERFKYINACATEVTKMATKFGWIEPKASGAQKKAKTGKRKMSTKI